MNPLNALAPVHLMVAQFVGDRAGRLRRRDDRGMEMVQAAALIVLTLAILSVLLSVGNGGIDQQIGNGIKDKITAIFNANDGAGGAGGAGG